MSVVIPEYAILSVLQTLRDKLEDGSLWDEPEVITGMSDSVRTDLKNALQKRPPNVGFIFPLDASSLPAITIQTEDWSTKQALLGELTSVVPREVFELVTPEVVLASAVGGETELQLDHPDVVYNTLVLYVNGVALDYLEFTVEYASGFVTLVTPLAASDVVTATYAFYGNNPIELIGEISAMRTRVFVEHDNVEAGMALSALIWREFTLKRNDLETVGGIKNLALSVVALSEWFDVRPALAWRREIIMFYEVEQVAGLQLARPPSTLQIDASVEDPAGTSDVVTSVKQGIS